MQKIISWNVASVRARMPVLTEFLRAEKPDVVLLQEIKATEETFPFWDLKMEGYEAVISGQKGYNGVAILSRQPLKNKITTLVGFEDQARFVSGETETGVIVISVYVPNGNPPQKDPADTSKLIYKLAWMKALGDYVAELIRGGRSVVLGGDFNVIERESDVYAPDLFRESALMIPNVQEAYRKITEGHLQNMIRKFYPEPHTYSFWDFQGGAWPKNDGILLDAIWVTSGVAEKVEGATIYKSIRALKGTSDHVPVGIELKESL